MDVLWWIVGMGTLKDYSPSANMRMAAPCKAQDYESDRPQGYAADSPAAFAAPTRAPSPAHLGCYPFAQVGSLPTRSAAVRNSHALCLESNRAKSRVGGGTCMQDEAHKSGIVVQWGRESWPQVWAYHSRGVDPRTFHLAPCPAPSAEHFLLAAERDVYLPATSIATNTS